MPSVPYPGCSEDRVCVHGNSWGSECRHCDGFNSRVERLMQDDVGQFSCEVIAGRVDDAINRLSALDPIDAVKIVLSSLMRRDAIVKLHEFSQLAERIGAFEEGPSDE